MKYLLLICFCITYLKTNSCSCRALGEITEEGISEYDFIARGIVISDLQPSTDYTVTFEFKILELFIGEVTDSVIEIKTNQGGGSCGYGAGENEMHLIFANRYQNELWTSICTRSVKIEKMPDTTRYTAPKGYWKNEFNKTAREYLAFLREFKN